MGVSTVATVSEAIVGGFDTKSVHCRIGAEVERIVKGGLSAALVGKVVAAPGHSQVLLHLCIDSTVDERDIVGVVVCKVTERVDCQ